MKHLKRLLLGLVLVVSLSAPRVSSAGWSCIIAAKFGGNCDVCNAACAVEAFFDYLGGW